MRAWVELEMLGGNCPVQGEGKINGVPFYFRARGQQWSIGIGEDPVGVGLGIKEGWRRSEPWGEVMHDAGWMPRETARDIIFRCAEEYTEQELKDELER